MESSLKAYYIITAMGHDFDKLKLNSGVSKSLGCLEIRSIKFAIKIYNN